MANPQADTLYWLRNHLPTEKDWLHCADQHFQYAMLNYLRSTKVPRTARGRRKLRLVACGLLRSLEIWASLTDANREAIEELERQAETGSRPNVCVTWDGMAGLANCAVYDAARANAAEALSHAFFRLQALDHRSAERHHADSLREVFGNPFRPTKMDPTWLHDTVIKLAQAAYDEREMPTGRLELTRLAVLADALEDAGCTTADLLNHLRHPGPHRRGCWPIDLLLGKG
jgi:hypothetical protein